jgi:ribosome maturation factor RimP
MQPNLLEQIRDRITPLLKEEGIELVDLSLAYAGDGQTLCFLVDRKGGITMNECSVLNRRIGAELEAFPLIDKSYVLEVSSPGLDRLLKTERDFERARGCRVKIVTREPIEKENTFEGLLTHVSGDIISIELLGGTQIQISLGIIAKARRVIKV